jgi:hypothetical protein
VPGQSLYGSKYVPVTTSGLPRPSTLRYITRVPVAMIMPS